MDKNKSSVVIVIIMISLALTVMLCIGFLSKPMYKADYPYYPNVESITNAANLIIVGEVVTAREVKNLAVDSTPNKTDKETTPYTLSTVKVIEVIKGNVSVGEVITVKQLGDYIHKPEETLYRMKGYLEKGTEHLMFLCEYEDSPYSAVSCSRHC